jgi:hypothetical protein
MPEPDIPLGDMNGSGTFDASDTPVFVIALVNPEQYYHDYGIRITVGDFNEDGDLDGEDIRGFVELLVIPE